MTHKPQERKVEYISKWRWLSKCCGSLVSYEGGDEGTSWWVCGNCNNPCDVKEIPLKPFDPIT